MIRMKLSLTVRKPDGRIPSGTVASVLRTAIPDLEAAVNKSFDTATDPVTGRAWAPRLKDYPHPPLQKTGRTREDAVQAVRLARVTGSSLTVAVRAKPLIYHQTGTRTMARRAPVGIPRRVGGRLARLLLSEGLKVYRSRRVA